MKNKFHWIMAKYKKNSFFGDAILYTIATMMTPAIGVVLLPVYTAYLTPTEYGTMTTVQAVVGVLQLIMILSLHGSVTRLYYDFINKKEELKKYIGSLFLFVLLFATLLSISLLLFKSILSNLLFNNIPSDPFFLYMVLLSFLSGVISMPLTLLRVQEKAWNFLIISLLKSLLILGISLYLVIGLKMGAEGPLLAQIISLSIVLLGFFFMIRKDLKLSFSWPYIKISLIFSLPLLPHSLSSWIITTSDQIILEKYVSLENLAFYALAAQMSTILRILYMSVNGAFLPRYIRLKTEGKDEDGKKLVQYFSIIIVISGIITILLSKFILHLLVAEQYYATHHFLIVLLVGEIILGFNFIVVANLFYNKKTSSISTSSLTAAFMNIIMNLILIPMIGVWGAVISTLTSMVTMLLLNSILIWRINKKTNVKKEGAV